METKYSEVFSYIIYANAAPLEGEDKYSWYFSLASKDRQAYIEKFKLKKDRMLSLAGGILLEEAIAGLCMAVNIPVLNDNLGFTKDENNRPILQSHPELFLSITHSYPYAAAMASTRPCGLDIESRERSIEKIAAKYFTEDELADCSMGVHPMDIWCRRECIIKSEKIKDLRFVDSSKIKDDLRFISPKIPGFSFEILAKKGEYILKEKLL